MSPCRLAVEPIERWKEILNFIKNHHDDHSHQQQSSSFNYNDNGPRSKAKISSEKKLKRYSNPPRIEWLELTAPRSSLILWFTKLSTDARKSCERRRRRRCDDWRVEWQRSSHNQRHSSAAAAESQQSIYKNDDGTRGYIERQQQKKEEKEICSCNSKS